jgi:hypothetical protein
MTTHTIIESFSAYDAVRAAEPGVERIWWTTSPYLLVYLPKRSETVRSPEEGLTPIEFNDLAITLGRVADDFCSWLQEQCPWLEYADLRLVLAPQLSRCLFVTLYKGLLLSRIVEAGKPDRIVCAGNPVDPGLQSFSLTYGRFDTLFACVASRWSPSAIQIIRHDVPQRLQSDLHQAVVQRRMPGFEKVLSLINNTPASFFYKGWRTLKAKGLWPGRGISFRPFPRRTFYVHNDCELLEEAFLGILLRGGRLVRLASLPGSGEDGVSPDDLPQSELLSARLAAMVRETMAASHLDYRNIYNACLDLVCKRTLLFLASLHGHFSELTRGFDQVTRTFRNRQEILTNGLSSPIERLFYCYCRSKKIPVNALDHGVTLGLSEFGVREAGHSAMLCADRAFYHCPRAVTVTRPHAPGQTAFVVGLPKITAHPPWQHLQRRLVRRWLKIEREEHVVFYVPELDRNNYIYGPYAENDWQFLHKTRDVTAALCRAFPRSRVVLKLYPTQRYLDHYDFSDFQEEHQNLLIVEGVDFRFVRTAADLIFVSNAQSTLGWVSGAGVPFVYLDFSWSPGRINGLRCAIPSIPGLAAAVFPDAKEVCDSDPKGVAPYLFTHEVKS